MTDDAQQTDQDRARQAAEAMRKAFQMVWLEIDEDDERAWDVPEFAERLNGSPHWITFQNPERAR